MPAGTHFCWMKFKHRFPAFFPLRLNVLHFVEAPSVLRFVHSEFYYVAEHRSIMIYLVQTPYISFFLCLVSWPGKRVVFSCLVSMLSYGFISGNLLLPLVFFPPVWLSSLPWLFPPGSHYRVYVDHVSLCLLPVGLVLCAREPAPCHHLVKE